MTELTGLELRRACCEALGWRQVELLAIESDIGVAWPIFVEWCDKHDFAWEATSNKPGHIYLDVADAATRLNDSCLHIRVTADTLPLAIARAIMEAEEKNA
jgi:hypothetical protein